MNILLFFKGRLFNKTDLWNFVHPLLIITLLILMYNAMIDIYVGLLLWA